MRGGASVALDDVRFAHGQTRFAFACAIEGGSVTAVMGASGSGKSTLLSLIAGFEPPLSGSIRIGGEDVTRYPPDRRPVSMIFQDNNLFAHLTVAQNVGLGRSPALRLTREDEADVAAALAATGLRGKGARLPGELSGGERQRVALARVLLRDRPVLLLDEPFASLGPALREEMLGLLADLHANLGMTVLLVTHQPDEALRIAGRVIFLQEGRVVADGDTRALLGPQAPPPVRAYLGSR